MSQKTRILLLFLFVLTGTLQAQFYTPAQITSIDQARTAAEGDLYLDTINENYYIGLTHGKLAKIGDTLDELIDSVKVRNDSVFIYQNNNTFSFLSRQNIFNSDGTLTSSRVLNGDGLSLSFTDIDSLVIDADTLFLNNIEKTSDTALQLLTLNKKGDFVEKSFLDAEVFYPIPSQTLTLTKTPLTGTVMVRLYYNGQLLTPNLDYTYSSNQINLLFGFNTEDVIQVFYFN